MRENEWRNWAEQQNRALRDAIRSSGKSRHSGGTGGFGAVVGLGAVALLLGLLFVLALPIGYPSYLVGRLVADTIHPLPGILVGLGVFAACLAALYFSRIARAVYAFPSAFALQLGSFLAVAGASDLVWASGASLLLGLLLYRAAFAVVRLRGEDISPALRAWLISGGLAVASLAPNFAAVFLAPDALRGGVVLEQAEPSPEESPERVRQQPASLSRSPTSLPQSPRDPATTATDTAPPAPDPLASLELPPGYFRNPSNGHIYHYVDVPGLSWAQARDAANNLRLGGSRGYLATVTSRGEWEFIQRNVFSGRQDVIYLGGSDAEHEGDWRWVTGPEGARDGGRGLLFWRGGSDGAPQNSSFVVWQQTAFQVGGPFDSEVADYLTMYSYFRPEFSTTRGDMDGVTALGGGSRGFLVEFGGQVP